MGDSDCSPSFNLVNEAWIPIVFVDGSPGEVSIVDAFASADKIRGIVGDIPQQELPILRLLLAVLYRACPIGDASEKGLLRQWQDVWSSRAFDLKAITEYLCFFENRFDLFDEANPFYQVPGLEYVGKESDLASELIADVPKPDKYLFSMRNRDHIEDLSFAEAARWTIFLQSYGTAGIKTPVQGNTHIKKGKVYPAKGSVGTGLLGAVGGVFIEGDTLFETLMLNLVLFDERSGGRSMIGNEGDFPTWERNNQNPNLRIAGTDEPSGPAGEFTWQSRRVRLVASADGTRVTGVICCYGDMGSVVDKQAVETMTAWRLSEAQQKKLGTPFVPLMPVTHDSSRSIWRGLSPLLSWSEKDDLRPGVVKWVARLVDAKILNRNEIEIHTQGMSYGTQNSVFADGIDDSFKIGSVLINCDSSACMRAIEVVSQAEKAVAQLAFFVQDVRKASGDKTVGSVSRVATEGVCETAYNKLDALFRMRLAHFPLDEEEAVVYCDTWRDEIHGCLLSLANDFVSTSSCPHFTEHEGMTVGRASLLFRSGLNKTLGARTLSTAKHNETQATTTKDIVREGM